MNFLNRLCLFSLLFTMVATSCKKPVPDIVKHIPKSASFVGLINTKALQGKLVANQATIENIMKYASGSDTSIAKGKQEWNDLKESGLDLDKNMYISIDQKSGSITSGNSNMIVAGIGSLSDEAKMEKYLQKKFPKGEIRKEKNYSFTTSEGNRMIAWNNDMVVTMTYENQGMHNMEYDSATGTFNFKNPVNAENNLKAEMDSYFTMKEDMSVASIPEFRDLMQNSADASMWVNSGSTMDAFPLPRVKELMGNSYTSATLNFEDGKVVVDSKSYYSNEMKELLKKYGAAEADLSMVEKYPSDKVNGFMVFSINPELVNAIVKQLELGGMADAQLTKMMGSNYTLQDLLKSLKGDFAFVVSDFNPKSNTDAGQTTSLTSGIKMLGNIAIGDRTQMNKLMDKLVEMKMMVKTVTGYALTPEIKARGFAATVDDKNILFSNNDTILTSYKSASKTAAIDNDAKNDFKGKQFAAYMDLQNMMNGFSQTTIADTSASAVLAKAKETFKDFRAYANKFNGKNLEVHYELKFVNDKENSLTSMLKFMETASKNMKDKKSKEFSLGDEAVPGADTLPFHKGAK